MQPDTLLRESLRFGFEREGVAVAACGPGDSFDPDLFEEPAEIVIAGGRTGDEARSVLALLRTVLADAPRKPPVLYVGNGIARSQAIAEGATEFLSQPVFVRDAVTVARLLASRKHENPAVLTGDLGQHFGLFYLVRAISALGRRGVLTLVRGMRRGELRFYDGEVTSAQVGLLHGIAALHQLLLWTEGRFELRPEDVVRRQQIPLAPSELFADAERFLSEIVAVAGELAPSACYEQDEQQIGRLSGRIPREVGVVLDLFDGTRTVADAVEDCHYRVFETLRIANRLHEIGLIRLRTGSRADEQAREALAVDDWQGARPDRGPGYVVVTRPGQGGPGADGHGRPRSVSGPQRAVTRGRKVRPERRNTRPLPDPPERARSRQETAPMPASAVAAMAARTEPLVVDWSQVIPGAIGSELSVSPVVPSSAAAGEISVSSAPPEASLVPAVRSGFPESALADLKAREPRPEPVRAPSSGRAASAAGEIAAPRRSPAKESEPVLLTRKVSTGTEAAGRSATAPPSRQGSMQSGGESAGEAGGGPVIEAVMEPVIERVDAASDPVAEPAAATPAAAAPPPRAPSARPSRAPSQPKLFSAQDEAFFAEGAELAAAKEESFDDLDDGYLPQSFWRRLFRGPHTPVQPRKPRPRRRR
ncbi:MAG TPA: DUF4388 domain-containing protein [Kofleriaceae bacterium]|nr:DUF4388 domain-containing protein [Kofleriaceae bacterium]